MIIAGKYEIPDECPDKCAIKEEGQGGYCHRCPIFNCSFINDHDEYTGARIRYRILEPEDYREDWAKEWWEFFEGGKIPLLYLNPAKGGEK
jgi:hypothetical protein